jgi:hypothetical protein
VGERGVLALGLGQVQALKRDDPLGGPARGRRDRGVGGQRRQRRAAARDERGEVPTVLVLGVVGVVVGSLRFGSHPPFAAGRIETAIRIQRVQQRPV